MFAWPLLKVSVYLGSEGLSTYTYHPRKLVTSSGSLFTASPQDPSRGGLLVDFDSKCPAPLEFSKMANVLEIQIHALTPKPLNPKTLNHGKLIAGPNRASEPRMHPIRLLVLEEHSHIRACAPSHPERLEPQTSQP